MSKAILVMDMPESCSKCMFLYEFSGIKKCNLMNVMYGGASRLSQSNFTKFRHDKCPRRPMPENKKISRYMNETEKGRCDGWNDCIDAMEGGVNKNEV